MFEYVGKFIVTTVFCMKQWRTEIPKALQNRAKLSPIVKTVKKIAEFRTPTLKDVQKKGSKILKLRSVRNCFTLAMTNRLSS